MPQSPPAEAPEPEPAYAPGREPAIMPAPAHLLALCKYESRLNAQLQKIIREIENCRARRERATRIPLSAL